MDTPQPTQLYYGTDGRPRRASASAVVRVSDTGHGYSLTNGIPLPVRYNTGTGKWVPPGSGSDAEAFIVRVEDANTFLIQSSGFHALGASHGLTDGALYYVASSAPYYTDTEPSTGQVQAIWRVYGDSLILAPSVGVDAASLGTPVRTVQRIVVGLSGVHDADTVDYLDTGDGAQLEAAITAANALATTYRVVVWLVDGTYIQLSDARSAASISVGSNVTVRGSEPGACEVATSEAGGGGLQRLFTVAKGGRVEHMTLRIKTATGGLAGGNGYLITISGGGTVPCEFRRLRVVWESTTTKTVAAIFGTDDAADAVIEDIELDASAFGTAAAPRVFYGFRIEHSNALVGGLTVRRIKSTGVERAVYLQRVMRPVISDLEVDFDPVPSVQAVGVFYRCAPGTTDAREGPAVRDVLMRTSQSTGDMACVRVEHEDGGILNTDVSNVRFMCSVASADDRSLVEIDNNSSDTLQGVWLRDGFAFNGDYGLWLQGDATGVTTDVSVHNVRGFAGFAPVADTGNLGSVYALTAHACGGPISLGTATQTGSILGNLGAVAVESAGIDVGHTVT